VARRGAPRPGPIDDRSPARTATTKTMSLTVDIPRSRAAPAVARRAVDRLEGRLADDLLPDIKLLVCELVTNSVKYASEGPVRLRIHSRGPRHVCVGVVDQGDGFAPAQRDRPVSEPGGFGLQLVQKLSDRWGVRDGASHVWFEIDRDHAEGPP
jgi:anti-sigma regulatory factor (Ser/Thr protein kinase)